MESKHTFKPTPYFSTPQYKNWRKGNKNAKNKDLSPSFPVSVNKWNSNGMELQFENEDGEKITFYLPELEKQLLLMNIERFVNGKEVTREDYNMDELQRQRHANYRAKNNEQNYIRK